MSRSTLIFFGILIVFGLYRVLKTSSPITTVSLDAVRTQLSDSPVDQSAKIETCISKKRCVFIYVAPWCPACHQLLGQFERIKSGLARKDIGVLLVVGADDDRQKEIALRNQYDADAILDTTTGQFRKINKIDAFPTLIVMQPSGKVDAYGSAAITLLNTFLKD